MHPLTRICVASVYRRKIIEVKIIDDEEYEKNKTFVIELGEPVLLEIGQKHGGCLDNRSVCLGRHPLVLRG